MKPLKDHEIEEMLTARPRPDVPNDLLLKIKADIPQTLDIEGDVDPVAITPPGRSGVYRRWMIAAMLLTTLGGSFLAYRMQVQSVPEMAAVSVLPSAKEPITRGDSTTQDATVSEESLAVGELEAIHDAPEAPNKAAQEKRAEARLQKPATARDDIASYSEIDAETAPPVLRQVPILEESIGSEQKKAREQLRERLKILSEAPSNTPGAPTRQRISVQPERRARPSLPDSVVDSLDAGIPAAPKAKEEIPKPLADQAVRYRRLEESNRFQVQPVPLSPQEAGEVMNQAEGQTVASMVRSPASERHNPEGAPYDDVFFKGYGTNPFIDTEDDALSTFGLDVDTASYTVARRYIRDGHLPPAEAIRVEEFINSFDYGDEPPRDADFAIHAEGAPSRFGASEKYYLLRFNLHGRELDSAAERKPAHLTFVIDVSGSMDRENRLGLVKRSLGLLLDQLREDDRVALVVYGSTGRVLLEPTSDKSRIRRAIEALRPEGSTNAEEGLRLAYELAARTARRGMINRVILCSDGVANVGATSAEALLERVRHAANQGVELTTVGFGMGNYSDVLMEQLANRGNGRYAYVDEISAARRIFVEDLTGTLQTLAAEARVQVEFNPDLVSRYRLVGYENRDVPDERFRDDTVDAGEIGVGHSVTALYEVKLVREPKKRDELATLRLRYGSIDRGEMVEVDKQILGRDIASRFENASSALRLTALVAEFAEILKGSYWSRGSDLDRVYRLTQQLAAERAGDRRLADLVAVMAEAASLKELESMP